MTFSHDTMARLLYAAAGALCEYLEKVLPLAIGDDWWQKGVLDMLTPTQLRILEQRGVQSIRGLDLAASLRILDQNWFRLPSADKLTHEMRNYLKEMHSVRNRWAHPSVHGFTVEDTYRDLDTLQRFLVSFEADEALIEEVRQAKYGVLPSAGTVTAPLPSGAPSQPAAESARIAPSMSEAPVPTTEFDVGQMVCLRSNPSARGVVISVLPGRPENRYTVFLDNQRATYYASQLQPEQSSALTYERLSLSDFHACLSALQIRNPSLSALYSLNAGRIDFIPYQFRPVLKFIRSDRPRMLIADSVGVGKTIEAGLILRELQARRDIRSVLIICPRPLVTERKWQTEMKRFDEQFTHLDGDTLRFFVHEMHLDGEWQALHQKTILPYSLFDRVTLFGGGERRRKAQKGLLELDPPPRFDLVIVDEAHHIQNTDTLTHQGVRFFCENAEAVVFMTATPIQLDSDDLYVLLNLLRPDLIIDRESFTQMAAPNPYINRAIEIVRTAELGWMTHAQEELENAAGTQWGKAILHQDPQFQQCRNSLAQLQMSPEDRVSLITALENLHTFNSMINRTRRRDIGDFTMRRPETVPVEFTPSQRQLHDALLLAQARIFGRLHGERNVMFMLTTLRRQAASCLYGLAPSIENILTRHLDRLAWEELNDREESAQLTDLNEIEDDILRVLEMAERLDENDPKLEALKHIIRNKQTSPNPRVMVFSSFRHTLGYLAKHLLADGFRVAMVHGGTLDDERVELRNRFRLDSAEPQALDVLLFSEVGCEGLDYQFCDCIVNYDLPWNPMRIEQRIGRIDRNGQQSESVSIYNLITPGTVDADIYDRCLWRIGVFDHELGANEEILGEIAREIENIAQDFGLSEEERRVKLEQLADNQIRLLQEQRRLEEQQADLFGIRLPTDRMRQEIEESTSFWLQPTALQNLVEKYLRMHSEKDQSFVLGERPLKTLRLSQELRLKLLDDLRALGRQTTFVYREWENWLKGGNPLLTITFDQDAANEHRDAVLITPVHPLVRQAAQAFHLSERVVTAVEVEDEDLAEGIYPFALYQWQFRGMRDDLAIRAVTQIPKLNNRLTELLAHGQSKDIDPGQWLDDTTAALLEDMHYSLWHQAREEHVDWTRKRSEHRRQSLETSHRARMALLTDQLAQATDVNIQRMRASQIANAQADYDRRVQELESSVREADVVAQPIAMGVLQVQSSQR